MTGLGWEFTSYHLENNVFLAYDADSIYGVPVDSPEYSKNKLRQMGFRVPLMFEFNTKRAPLPTEAELLAGNVKDFDRKGNFHIAVGVATTGRTAPRATTNCCPTAQRPVYAWVTEA
jgi:hypothetical protein